APPSPPSVARPGDWGATLPGAPVFLPQVFPARRGIGNALLIPRRSDRASGLLAPTLSASLRPPGGPDLAAPGRRRSPWPGTGTPACRTGRPTAAPPRCRSAGAAGTGPGCPG